MQTKRTEVEARIIRDARALLDALDDGLQLDYISYGAFADLSRAYRDYDDLDVTPIHGNDHPANALGPETEHYAAATTQMLRSKVRREVVEQLIITRHHQAESGLSCQQLEGRLKREHPTVSSAVNWLKDNLWIEDSGYHRKNRSGRPAIVWRLTPNAVVAVRHGLDGLHA